MMVNHDFDHCSRPCIAPKLIKDCFGMRRVMDHSKGVDEVVRLDRNECGKALRVAMAEPNLVVEAEDLGALAG
jgi:hypothetical protein